MRNAEYYGNSIQEAYQPWEGLVESGRSFHQKVDSAITSPEQTYHKGYVLLAQLMDRGDAARYTDQGLVDWGKLSKASAYTALMRVRGTLAKSRFIAGAMQESSLIDPQTFPSDHSQTLLAMMGNEPWIMNTSMYTRNLGKNDRFTKLQTAFNQAAVSQTDPLRVYTHTMRLEYEAKKAMLFGITNVMHNYTQDGPIRYNASSDGEIQILKYMRLAKLIAGDNAAKRDRWSYAEERYGSEYWLGYYQMASKAVKRVVAEAEIPYWATSAMKNAVFMRTSNYPSVNPVGLWTPIFDGVAKGDKTATQDYLKVVGAMYPKLFGRGLSSGK